MRFLDRVDDSRRLKILYISMGSEKRAYAILRQYADQDFSFVEATSFAAMRVMRIRHAFAFDQHFATAGFLRLPHDLAIAQL